MRQFKELTLRDFYDNKLILTALPKLKFRVHAIAEIRDLNDGDGIEAVDIEIKRLWIIDDSNPYGEFEIAVDFKCFISEHKAAYKEIVEMISRRAIAEAKSVPESFWSHYEHYEESV